MERILRTQSLENPKIIDPTLSGVLQVKNIRGLTLTPLLTATSEIETQGWRVNVPGLNLLHVSRDIRKLAWKFFLEGNTWVRARFVFDAARLVQPLPSAIFYTMDHNDHPKPGLVQAIFVPDRFTAEMIKEFQSSVAATISIGQSQGQTQQADADKNKSFSVVFALLPQKFDLFVRSLADTVEQWESMTVEVNHAHISRVPSTIPIVVDHIIRGLDQIREANRVTSTSLLKDPIDPVVDFKKISQAMMSPREVNSGIRTKLLEFYNRGTTSFEKGDYDEACKAFCKGQDAYFTFRHGKELKPKRGSVERNAIELVQADIAIMGAESINRMVSTRTGGGYAEPRLMTREVKSLSTAFMLAEFSLECPSITDDRRFYGHCRRAVASANLGDFLTELNTEIPEPERAALLDNFPPQMKDAGSCYKRAAKDAFHAVHLAGTAVPDAPQELVDTINALRRRACDRLGYDADKHFARMHRHGLLRMQLPVLGLWEGDPVFLKNWGRGGMMLLALFRQQEGSGGPGIGEIKEAFAKRGLSWSYNQDGEVFLDGKADAHRRPTWVVPDNTRDGLRAAGLSGDEFEIARR